MWPYRGRRGPRGVAVPVPGDIPVVRELDCGCLGAECAPVRAAARVVCPGVALRVLLAERACARGQHQERLARFGARPPCPPPAASVVERLSEGGTSRGHRSQQAAPLAAAPAQ